MPTLRIPDMMKFYTAGQTELVLHGASMAEVLNDLVIQYPAIKPHILDLHGKPRRYINIFVNQVNIKELNNLETTLADPDKIILLPSISGG